MRKRIDLYLSKSVALLLIICCVSCADKPPETNSSDSSIKEGNWVMNMAIDGRVLPFQFSYKVTEGAAIIEIYNGDEIIKVDEIIHKEDSVLIKMPVFESEFRLNVLSNKSLEGVWINYYKGNDYKIPVKAIFGTNERFAHKKAAPPKDGKYEVVFGASAEDKYKAIGMFKEKNGVQYGTFATETGDYRHLEGVRTEDSLFLSTFDGSHAFLFEAKVMGDSMDGVFWSGSHFKTPWRAFKNPQTKLQNADSLTFLKEGYDSFSFRFPDQNGDTVSLADDRFKNKAVIVQIMGSWCPNCLDETNYYKTLYDQYNSLGLEIVALAFERTKTEEKAYKNLQRLVKRTGVKYTVLLGGATRETKAAEVLPMLNHVMSYPTSIFLDKNHKIKRIHTGFYGPSTGEYYTRFVSETEKLVEEMLES